MLVNGKKLTETQLLEIFERESEKIRISLSYNYFKLLDAIRKTQKDFDLKKIIKMTEEEILSEMGRIELPSLDRLNKDNLNFNDRKKEIPKTFKNKIKVEL